MGSAVILTLLTVNSLLILALVVMLCAVLRQSRRINRLARQSEELAEHLQERSSDLQELPPPAEEGSEESHG